MTTASKITMVRVVLIPFFIVFLLLSGNGGANADTYRWIALAIFVVASLSDFLDGYVARHYNQVTDFGKFFLHNDELVRHEREILSKLSRTGITFNIQNRTTEAKQVTQNRVILNINTFQFFSCFRFLFQDTFLNNFIHGGRR